MSTNEILDSLTLLEKDWDIDPIIRKFILGKYTNVSDFTLKVKDVIFHIPYLPEEKKYILWKCYWPDRCVSQDSARDREPLFLTAGQPDAAFADDGVVTIGEIEDEGFGVGRARRFDHLVVRGVGASEVDVVSNSPVEQKNVLEY